jgi:hypothetical protein
MALAANKVWRIRVVAGLGNFNGFLSARLAEFGHSEA